MIRSRFQRRTAWLAMLAIWLIVVAPVVSQIHAASDMSAMDDNCSMAAMGHAAMGHGVVKHGDPASPDSPDRQPQPMEKCGYCFLLAHNPVMPGIGVALPMPSPLLADTFAVKPTRISAKPSVAAASPRGPPSSLQS